MKCFNVWSIHCEYLSGPNKLQQIIQRWTSQFDLYIWAKVTFGQRLHWNIIIARFFILVFSINQYILNASLANIVWLDLCMKVKVDQIIWLSTQDIPLVVLHFEYLIYSPYTLTFHTKMTMLDSSLTRSHSPASGFLL